MSENRTTDNGRRQFLGGALALGGITVAPGVFLMNVAGAKPAHEAVTSDVRWGLLVDTTKCADGCDACVRACQAENGWGGPDSNEVRSSDDQKAQWIRKVHLRNKQTGSTHSLPLMCQHCEHPPCEDVCPTGASFRRADGIVLVDKHICIGCRYCMMACPYKARSFIHEDLHGQKVNAPRGKGTVESCTLCVHRVDNDREPACVEACAAEGRRALIFGDMKDPGSEISQRLKRLGVRQLRADLGLNPGVHYEGV